MSRAPAECLVFISYRRADNAAGYSRSLSRTLKKAFGSARVFRDISSISPGQDFPDTILKMLASCRVMLVMIGNHWTSVTDADGNRRLFNSGDWVRREVALALTRDDLTVIPVLVCGATMPSAEQLPPDLVRLTRLHAFEMSDHDWERDRELLIARLADITGLQPRIHRYRRTLVDRVMESVEAANRARAPRHQQNPGWVWLLFRRLGRWLKILLFLAILLFVGASLSEEFASLLARIWENLLALSEKLLPVPAD